MAEARPEAPPPLTLTLLFGISDPAATRYCAELSPGPLGSARPTHCLGT
jgi:hypothetical protein